MLRRFCVFSHDELVCKMSLDPDALDLTVAAATYQDMLQMVDSEKKMRRSLLEWVQFCQLIMIVYDIMCYYRISSNWNLL
jgi:hypothetical protein